MNTIIYIYPGRDDARFTIEKLDETDYCLIRLGLPVPLWKHLKQWDKEKQGEQEKQDKPECGPQICVEVTVAERQGGTRSGWERRRGIRLSEKGKFIWNRLRRGRRNVVAESVEVPGMGEEEMQQEATKQEELRQEALRQQLTMLLAELVPLQTALCLMGGNTYWTYAVYEQRLRLKIDTRSWWDTWMIPEFVNYSQPLWAEKILSHGDCHKFLILGQSDAIPGMLWINARRMQSVKWYLLQKEYTEETESYVDSFYEEYGLAIEVHLLEEKKDWCRLCFLCPDPVKVLDFTGEAKVSVCGVAKGSIWLDMNAMDEKAGRMEVRNQGIEYFSLKKLWGGLQKPVNTLTLL